mmetsp:Transcript_799/g.1969  ORF Transcript_799/g.1969 Transcript_799/m.1969 type:complete len:112 (-) Transcript_799:20-355(-)
MQSVVRLHHLPHHNNNKKKIVGNSTASNSVSRSPWIQGISCRLWSFIRGVSSTVQRSTTWGIESDGFHSSSVHSSPVHSSPVVKQNTLRFALAIKSGMNPTHCDGESIQQA